MKRIFLAIGLITALGFLSCSSDDDGAKSNCQSCNTSNSIKVEICDNGDDTFTYTAGDLSDTVTQEELDDAELTPKEFIDLACLVGL